MKKIVFLILILISNVAFSSQEKIALIIGNSKYLNLGTLANTTNDARAIEKSLKEIGYKTRIVFDANSVQARKEIRSFAIDSENASIALLFYAGHGAQVFGENYLLPVDLDIPKRESDIQLSGLKVDDIINSIHSKVKVVFLDACRDNPALIKSLSKGRGSYPGGLATPKNSSMSDSSSGIFIAYSTDSGNIALDGEGKNNSPFTEALVKYVKEPISIDDMFSKVTKEVREKTNNSQKPFKYASLDGVFCLTDKCGNNSNFNSLEKNKVSNNSASNGNFNSSQIKIAMLSGESSKKNNSQMSTHDLPSNWVMFGYTNDKDSKPDVFWYIQPSSIEKNNNNLTVRIKSVPISQSSVTKNPSIALWTFNCDSRKAGMSEIKEFDSQDNVLKDEKIRDPEFTDLNMEFSSPGSAGYKFITLACNSEKLVPILDGNDSNSDWHRLFTSPQGELQEDTSYLESSLVSKDGMIKVFVKEEFKTDQKLSSYTMFSPLKGLQLPSFRQRIMLTQFRCDSDEYSMPLEQLFDSNNQLIFYSDLSITKPFKTIPDDPSSFLRRKFCK